MSNLPLPACWSVEYGDAFRLDVAAATGQRSIRINGTYGAVLEGDGKEHVLPPATSRDGVLAFPSLLVQAFVASPVSVLEGGMITIDGKILHRITVVRPVFSGAPAAWMSTVDLYFDPTTHLLAKSVSAVQLDAADSERYLRSVTYGDYQKVGQVLLPLSYQENLNGQPQWTLQLTNVQLNPAVDGSYFRF